MDAFLAAVYQDPMHYVEYLFAIFGALGIGLFCAGLAIGIPNLFTNAEGAEHLKHARAQAVWGLLLVMVTWGWWEVVRVIVGWASLPYLILALLLLTPMWIPWLKGLAGGGSGGGH